ncbi:MAG: hypothetical protein Q8922_08140 [Bacteroidota bacterium]|nr:hypothetical protein [Bacteroidota bacterium]MDP4234193.1 hypothetical protein [Bacteroidota bacterium]MDP4243741.1 hypothetical protein [Bacteroidota bacterium]MDP4287894.1 hypothetical protein [Bacteroidota bacterium]
MKSRLQKTLGRSSSWISVILATAMTCGCGFWAGNPPKEGLYLDSYNVDFGVVKANDTSSNGIGIINNTNTTYLIQKPRLAHGIHFWLTRNFGRPVDTLDHGNYNSCIEFDFTAKTPGTYRDTLRINSFPDTTHILLSAPIVAICR